MRLWSMFDLKGVSGRKGRRGEDLKEDGRASSLQNESVFCDRDDETFLVTQLEIDIYFLFT